MTTINKLNAVPEAPVTVHLIDAGDDDPANPDARIHCTQYAAAIINGVRIPLARSKGFRIEASEDDATIAYLPVFVNQLHATFEHPADETTSQVTEQQQAKALRRVELQAKADLLNVQIATWRHARAQVSTQVGKDVLTRSILKARDELAATNAELATTPTPQ